MPTNRGFAAMDPEKQREIASKGGKISGMNRSAGLKTGNKSRTGGTKRGGRK